MSGFEMRGARRFTPADQARFAEASGDLNPMHLDAVAARRTQAGVPVAHGVNVLLWALDRLLEDEPDLPVAGLAVRFERFVAVGEAVELWVRPGPGATKLEVRSGDARLVSATVRHQPKPGSAPDYGVLAAGEAAAPPPPQPVALDFEAAAIARGVLAVGGARGLHPQVAARLGEERTAAVMALSTLVGMVAPGLHSIFSSLELEFDGGDAPAGALAFKVREAHEVFRLLTLDVAARGLRGSLEAFVRLPPVVQPTAAELRAMVAPGAFAGVSALVVGGSRGLGEVTAKLLAAGGARVAISYAVGAQDAEAVAADIRGAGGACATLRLDARQLFGPQLAGWDEAPNQLYYFATTKIFLQKGELFSPAVLADFQKVYVDGFADLCRVFSERKGGEVAAFYPSTVAIDERPRAMTEYTMAKAAAEILCADIDRFLPRVRTVVRRLPRLLTDQTATVTPVPTPPAADVMLEAVQAMAALRSTA